MSSYLSGSDLLSELGDTWDYFYKEIMPTIQLVFFPLTVGLFVN